VSDISGFVGAVASAEVRGRVGTHAARGETWPEIIYTCSVSLSNTRMGTRPNVKVYPAVKVKMAEVHKGGWSAVTHMTADDMCAFARDLFDAAHNTGSGAARMVHDFGLGIVCLGWTPEGIKANAHRGLALFKVGGCAPHTPASIVH
jgi:hypothetical protein